MRNKNIIIILLGIVLVCGIICSENILLMNLKNKDCKYQSNIYRKEMYPLDSLRYKFL